MTISSGDPQSLEIAALGRPTRVRYQVLALAVVMAVLLYLDRMAISVALPAISRDLNLDLGQAADSVAAFFWCYALCQIPAGWLGDRWGSRRALVLYVVAWSASDKLAPTPPRRACSDAGFLSPGAGWPIAPYRSAEELAACSLQLRLPF
jgi:MFS family permease